MPIERTEYNIVLKNIKKLFSIHFDKTKRILIASERLTDTTNFDVFFDLSRILDEIYLMIMEPSDENIRKRCRYIEGQFIAAQNQCAIIYVYSLKKEFLKNKINNKEIDKIIEKIIKFLIEKNIAIEKTKEIEFEKLKLSYPDENDLKNAIEINQILINYFAELVKTILPDWDVLGTTCTMPEGEKKKLHGMTFLEKFIDVICEYNLARTVLIDILTRQGRHYSFAITELRDALDHIDKSFDEKNDYLVELSYASEHIRRASVESLQTYVQKQLEMKYAKLVYEDNINKNLQNIFNIKKELCVGRYIKAHSTWYYSIDNFYNALQLLDKLE